MYLKCKDIDRNSVATGVEYGDQINQLLALKDKDVDYVVTQLVRYAIFNINYLT